MRTREYSGVLGTVQYLVLMAGTRTSRHGVLEYLYQVPEPWGTVGTWYRYSTTGTWYQLFGEPGTGTIGTRSTRSTWYGTPSTAGTGTRFANLPGK